MTRQGLDTVVAAMQKVLAANPEIFAPIEKFFGIDIDDRLHNPVHQEGLWYDYE
jgi:hypothetical protein